MIIGNQTNIRIARILDKCHVYHESGNVYYGGEDYENDLNAMHKAEEIFLQKDGCAWGKDWERYCTALAKRCFMSDPPTCLARAESKQRAEAFLEVMD